MNKNLRNGLIILVVVCVVVLAVYLARRGGEEPVVTVKEAQEVVAELLVPRPVPAEPVELSPLVFETIEEVAEVEVIEAPSPEEPGAVVDAVVEAEAGPVVRVSAEQVLAVVNGVPLTGAQIMPPGRFQKGGDVALAPEVLEDVLERSIQRELILQEADVQGVALDERDLVQLEDMYRHLTSNPLELKGGWTLGDLDVLGDEKDAEFHVRDKAARLLQVRFLQQAGETDTLEARTAFREGLRSVATIETVSTEPPPEE